MLKGKKFDAFTLPRHAFCSPCLCRAKGVKSTRAPPYSLLLYK